MMSPLVSFIIAVCWRRSHPEPPDIAKGHTYSLCLNWDTEVPLGIETNSPPLSQIMEIHKEDEQIIWCRTICICIIDQHQPMYIRTCMPMTTILMATSQCRRVQDSYPTRWNTTTPIARRSLARATRIYATIQTPVFQINVACLQNHPSPSIIISLLFLPFHKLR